jgi:hypothetical protein
LFEATISYPRKGTKGRMPFVAYGTCYGLCHLFGILEDEKTGRIFLGRTVVEGSFWTVLFCDLPTTGTYTFRLLGFPGGLLGSVPNVKIAWKYAVGIQHPIAPGDNPVCPQFSAVGYASTNGAPSGTVTRRSDGKQWSGVPQANGPF